MIHHKIVNELRKIYTVKVPISKNEIHRIKRCLNEESLEEMSDEELEKWKYKKDSIELIYNVEFPDGCSLRWELCSGTHNYYDNVVFSFNDGTWTEFDCDYDIDDIEVETYHTTYIVKLVVE